MLRSEINKNTLKKLENKNLWYELISTDVLKRGDFFIYTSRGCEAIYNLEEVYSYAGSPLSLYTDHFYSDLNFRCFRKLKTTPKGNKLITKGV